MNADDERRREVIGLVVPGAIVAAFVGCGCLNPIETRLPTVAPAPTFVEERSLQRFDPYADPQIGPDTEARPREFRENVNDVRRLYSTGGLGPDPFATGPSLSRGDYRYPHAVR